MKILIKKANITDPGSPENGKTKDILISNGNIEKIEDDLQADAEEKISGENLCVSPGWFDMRANFFDPGMEYREDIISGSLAAAYGGITGVALLPDTTPPVDNKTQVNYIKRRGLVDIYPIAALSVGLKGEWITEMSDLRNSGAVAFTDGNRNIPSAKIIARAMEYVTAFDGLVIIHPEEKSLSIDGQVNEGIINVQLGMKGIPSIGEEMALKSLVDLCRYTGSRIHISRLSTGASLDIIRAARKEGLHITCDVTAHHLYFSENDLLDYNTNLKLNPPLRDPANVEALRKGVKDGTIDAIVSDHWPLEEEKKKCEFPLAGFGASGIQTLFSQLNEIFGDPAVFMRQISVNPRKILGLDPGKIATGSPANLTVFAPDEKWELNENTNKSKSKNSPLFNKTLKGRAIAILNRSEICKLDLFQEGASF